MEQQDVLRMLEKGATQWNLWRKQQLQQHAQQYPLELNLDGVRLSGMNLDDYDLSKISFANSQISQCSFRGADLILANFAGAELQHCDFTLAKLIAANLSGARINSCKLARANMLTAITHHAALENIDFRGQDIGGLVLNHISLAGSNLSGQSLARVDFSHSNLEGVNFEGADLTQALFSGANLVNARMKSAKLSGAIFKNAKLQGIDLTGLDLHKADFSGANLSGCDLRSANLAKAKLNNASITAAKLWKINSQGWAIANIQCEHASWDEAGRQKTYYRPHEFERLFAESITIELRYPYRLSDHELATLPIFIEHLAAVHWGTIVRLKSISEVAGGALVRFVVEEVGSHNPSELKTQLQTEAERIQLAQLTLRTNTQMHLQLKEKIGAIREEFWPRLLELAADHEHEQTRNLTIIFMDLKGFSKWSADELSEKLSLFRGLVKPILTKWGASHPNMEGDSLRITFKNATAGLSCACMMRAVLMAAGFELRIGVELGEVLVVHNEITNIPDLEGVAVSMAARMEAAAEPGEVLVSQRVRHYAEPSGLFSFAPRQVPLTKAIGRLAKGGLIECFAVELRSNNL